MGLSASSAIKVWRTERCLHMHSDCKNRRRCGRRPPSTAALALIYPVATIFLIWADTVEKLRKECAAKIRPNAIMSKNRRSMPSQCSYGGLWLLAPQLPRPPKSLFDPQACGPPNYYWSPKTEFFNGIDPMQKSQLLTNKYPFAKPTYRSARAAGKRMPPASTVLFRTGFGRGLEKLTEL
jgi:hypothetical protein